MAASSPRQRALRITLLYAGLAGAWIALSDLFVFGISPATAASIAKGLAFVVVTGFLLQLLIERAFRRSPEAERLRAAARIEESEARFRALVEQSISGIYVIQDGRFAYANPRMATVFGYGSPAGITGLAVEALVVPEDRGTVAENIGERLSGRVKSATYSFRGLRKDGQVVDIGVHGSIATYDGRPAIIGTLQDITEHKRFEDARIERLARAQRQLQAVGGVALSKALLAGDVRQLAREVTKAAAEAVGVERANVWLFSDDESELRCIDDYHASAGTHGDGRVLAEAQYANEFAALKASRYVAANDPYTDPRTAGYAEGYLKPLGITSMLDAVIQVSGKHLGLLCLEHVGRPHRWEQDEIAFACQLADKLALAITLRERRDAQDASRESEARFRAMIEQSISGTFIAGADGRMIYANPRLAEILGFDDEAELVGMPALDMVAPEDRERAADTMRRHLAGEERGQRYSFAAMRRDGVRVTLGAHGTAGTYAGQRVLIGVAQDVTELLHAEEEIKGYVAKLEHAMQGTLEVIAKMVELRDPYTRGHERRVAEICAAIGAELGLPAERIEGLRVAGSVHDVGKIAAPAEILSKPTRLTPSEYALVKEHAQLGYEILKEVEFPWPVAEVARQHHERMDGSGYPRGLKDGEILLEARILAVADVVEAMSSHRPYRPSMGIEAALAEIERGAGAQYDAEVSAVCLRLFREKGYTLPA